MRRQAKKNKAVAQGHRVHKWQNQDPNRGGLAPKATCSATIQPVVPSTLHPSNQNSIYPFNIQPSSHSPIHLSICLSSHLFIHPFIHPPIHSSFHPSISSSINLSKHSSKHMFIHPSKHSTIHPLYLSILAVCSSIHHPAVHESI